LSPQSAPTGWAQTLAAALIHESEHILFLDTTRSAWPSPWAYKRSRRFRRRYPSTASSYEFFRTLLLDVRRSLDSAIRASETLILLSGLTHSQRGEVQPGLCGRRVHASFSHIQRRPRQPYLVKCGQVMAAKCYGLSIGIFSIRTSLSGRQVSLCPYIAEVT
jgi:hypothetical protein